MKCAILELPLTFDLNGLGASLCMIKKTFNDICREKKFGPHLMGGDHCQNPQNFEEECEKLKSRVTV